MATTNPYPAGSQSHSDWAFGYRNARWAAPSSRATSAMWYGYHAQAKDEACGGAVTNDNAEMTPAVRSQE